MNKSNLTKQGVRNLGNTNRRKPYNCDHVWRAAVDSPYTEVFEECVKCGEKQPQANSYQDIY